MTKLSSRIQGGHLSLNPRHIGGLIVALICLCHTNLSWAQCEHLQQAIEREEKAQTNDFYTGMAGILGGGAMIQQNCKGYDCLLNTQKNNNEVMNRYNSESDRHKTNLMVLRPSLERCESAVEGMERWLREAQQDRREHERNR